MSYRIGLLIWLMALAACQSNGIQAKDTAKKTPVVQQDETPLRKFLAAKGYESFALDLYRSKQMSAIRQCAQQMDRENAPNCGDAASLKAAMDKIKQKTVERKNEIDQKAQQDKAKVENDAKDDINKEKQDYIINNRKQLEKFKPDGYIVVQGCDKEAKILSDELLTGKSIEDISLLISAYEDCLNFHQNIELKSSSHPANNNQTGVAGARAETASDVEPYNNFNASPTNVDASPSSSSLYSNSATEQQKGQSSVNRLGNEATNAARNYRKLQINNPLKNPPGVLQ